MPVNNLSSADDMPVAGGVLHHVCFVVESMADANRIVMIVYLQETPELSPFDVYPDASHEITHSQPGSSDGSGLVPAVPGEPAPGVDNDNDSPKALGGEAPRHPETAGFTLCSMVQ
jgi:hypothetical protein